MTTHSPTAGSASLESRWRLVTATVAAAVLTAVLGGCAAGFSAQTEQPYQPAEGISNRQSEVYAIDSLVVTDGRGNGTVVSGLVNQAPKSDSLVNVTASMQGKSLPVTNTSGSAIKLPTQTGVQLAHSADIRIGGNFKAGEIVTLTFEFANAAPVTVHVPVVGNGSTYAGVPVGPITPTAGPTMTPLTPTAATSP